MEGGDIALAHSKLRKSYLFIIFYLQTIQGKYHITCSMIIYCRNPRSNCKVIANRIITHRKQTLLLSRIRVSLDHWKRRYPQACGAHGYQGNRFNGLIRSNRRERKQSHKLQFIHFPFGNYFTSGFYFKGDIFMGEGLIG